MEEPITLRILLEEKRRRSVYSPIETFHLPSSPSGKEGLAKLFGERAILMLKGIQANYFSNKKVYDQTFEELTGSLKNIDSTDIRDLLAKIERQVFSLLDKPQLKIDSPLWFSDLPNSEKLTNRYQSYLGSLSGYIGELFNKQIKHPSISGEDVLTKAVRFGEVMDKSLKQQEIFEQDIKKYSPHS